MTAQPIARPVVLSQRNATDQVTARIQAAKASDRLPYLGGQP